MAEEQVDANRQLLETTAQHGFIAPATVASVLALQEQMLVALIMRLGGEAHFADFAERLGDSPDAMLDAELSEDGTYIVRVVSA